MRDRFPFHTLLFVCFVVFSVLWWLWWVGGVGRIVIISWSLWGFKKYYFGLFQIVLSLYCIHFLESDFFLGWCFCLFVLECFLCMFEVIAFGKLSLGGTYLLPFLFLSVLTFPFWWFLLVPMCPQFRTRACVGALCSVPWGSVRCRPWASLGLGQVHSCITNLPLLFLPLLVNPCWLWLFSACALGQAWFCPLPLVGHLFLLALSS